MTLAESVIMTSKQLAIASGQQIAIADSMRDLGVLSFSCLSTQTQTTQGKNLFGYNGSLPYTSSGVTMTYSNGQYTIIGTTTGYPYKAIYTIKANTLPDGNYYSSRNKISGVDLPLIRIVDRTVTPTVIKTNGNGALVISGGHPDLLVEIATNINTTYNCVINIQLELGTTATSYAPFVPNSPSPEYPSPTLSSGDEGYLRVISTDGGSNTVTADITLPSGFVGGSLQNGVADTVDDLGNVIGRLKNATLTAGTSWVLADAEPNSTVRSTAFLPTALNGTTLNYAAGVSVSFDVQYQLATPLTATIPQTEVDTWAGNTVITTENAVKPTVTVKYTKI